MKKIYCEKCQKDITSTVSRTFEENKVGNISCPHCGTKQKRYLSETDLLIYLSYQEIVYFILSFVTSLLLRQLSITWITIVFLIAMFILSIFITQHFKTKIYTEGLIKKETMYKSQVEEADRISRSIRWQFFMFFALVITFFTETIAYWFFVGASIVVIIITVVKAFLSAKKEKEN